MTILQIEIELRSRLDSVRGRLAALRDEQLFLAGLIEAIEAVGA